MVDTVFVSSVAAVTVCLVCAALASGLTQGLLTIDIMELMIKKRSGTEVEQRQARNLLPLLDKHHWLICTLMLWNATAMEILPLYLSKLVPEWLSLVLSVTLILIVGEIVPSAILTGPNQIRIASFLTPLVYTAVTIFSPVAYPMSLALDYIIGEDEPITTYNKLELEQMVKIQHEEMTKRISTIDRKSSVGARETLAAHPEEGVNNEEVNMIAGVLNFSSILVKEKMTSEIFSLNVADRFDSKTLNKIFREGYSRIPIYEGTKNNIIGLVLTKELLFVDLEDEVPIRTFISLFPRDVACVREDDTLRETLKMFQETRTHLAVVYASTPMPDTASAAALAARPSFGVTSDHLAGTGIRSSLHPIDEDEAKETGEAEVQEVVTDHELVGIITLEDIVECIIGEEIMDETDDIGGKLGHEERDMELIRLRLLHPGQAFGPHSKILKLSSQETQAVAAHLRANVPQVRTLFGDNLDAIKKYVSECSVMEISKSDTETLRGRSFSQKDPTASTPASTPSSTSSSSKVVLSEFFSPIHGPPTVGRPVFFKRSEPANMCTLILSGKMEVLSGREKFRVELGAWTVLGQDALVSAHDQYIPDFSMFVLSEKVRVLCLCPPHSHSKSKSNKIDHMT